MALSASGRQLMVTRTKPVPVFFFISFIMASDQGSDDSLRHVHNRQRKLENHLVATIRQVIGGVIGTGLFLGKAPSLMYGGPLGLLLVYVFMGTICLATMLSLGEMTTFLPVPGGFITLTERFVDRAFAFAIARSLTLTTWLTLPAELSAAAVIIGYWKTDPAVWITVCLVVAIGINALVFDKHFFNNSSHPLSSAIGAYGEAEFWFSSIKVVTIAGLIILGIIVDLSGGPNHDRIGF
ncbi:hypothetical protein OG21DRAFT_1487962 [Imleria badia]|nr:hypothetical protein OG21DRAFT_1487962 [Imleria badia]